MYVDRYNDRYNIVSYAYHENEGLPTFIPTYTFFFLNCILQFFFDYKFT